MHKLNLDVEKFSDENLMKTSKAEMNFQMMHFQDD